jgi:hypothetical protein
MKKNFSLFICFVIPVIFSSCCHEHEKGNLEDGSLFGSIMRTDSNFFRGIDLRDSLKHIKLAHKELPTQEENDHLYYRAYINNLERLNVTYNFKDSLLYEARIEVKLCSKNRLDELREKFTSYFSAKYGTYEKDDEGFLIWKAETARSKDIEVSLKDESTEKKFALRMAFYDYEM